MLPKEEMQLLIQQALGTQNMQAAYEALKIYQKTFGTDDFTDKYISAIYDYGPLVSLICLYCPDDVIDNFLSEQSYHNLEIVRTSTGDSYKDIIEYMAATDSKYICFLEDRHRCAPSKIAEMVWRLETLATIQVAISPRNFIDNENTILAHPDYAYEPALNGNLFSGKTLLEYSIREGKNLYGTLSALLVSTAYARQIPWEIPTGSFDSINRVSMIYQLLLNGNVCYMNTPLVSTVVESFQNQHELCDAYKAYVSTLTNKNLIAYSYHPTEHTAPSAHSVSKDITFFYTDKGEYYNLQPIADEAVNRGYRVTFTENLTQKAEIGVYCQHVCYPENSKFSLILLHDLAQGHNRWPNIWEAERWHNFDIGIVPGKFWANLWEQCACQYYVHPRCGTYELGYPKSDKLSDASLKARAQELRDKFDFKYNYSILYAPSWENDGKEDDFVKALSSLDVNLLIKQAHWSDKYGHIIENIKHMRRLHEGNYDNVYYIEPEESILTALELCDMVVSDESSVMAEAAMFGKPSIAVIDWLIPDITPSRFACVPMDYVLKCKKSELKDSVENLRSDPARYASVFQKASLVFSNQGHCCSDILDAIDYFTQGASKDDFQSKKLSSRYTMCSMWN